MTFLFCSFELIDGWAGRGRGRRSVLLFHCFFSSFFVGSPEKKEKMLSSQLSVSLKLALDALLVQSPVNGATWTPLLCAELLRDEEPLLAAAAAAAGNEPPSSSSTLTSLPAHPGVPSRPFYSAIADVMSRWAEGGAFPFKHIPFPLLKEKEIYFQRCCCFCPCCCQLVVVNMLPCMVFWIRLEQMHQEIVELHGQWEATVPEVQVTLVTSFLEVSCHCSLHHFLVIRVQTVLIGDCLVSL